MSKFNIKKPIVTEKSTAMSHAGKYIFLVDDNTSAPEIKKAIKDVYKVTVVGTNVINTPPKPKRFGRNMTIKSGYKKIIVTLKAGEKLDILPQ